MRYYKLKFPEMYVVNCCMYIFGIDMKKCIIGFELYAHWFDSCVWSEDVPEDLVRVVSEYISDPFFEIEVRRLCGCV